LSKFIWTITNFHSVLRKELSNVHQKQANYILLSKEGQGQALSLQTPIIL